MSIIKLLDRHVAELIAAGEVVDRPASIVKELVENSIDAGASRITVEIRGGGSDYIRVTDNGCGMSSDDAELCFSRHATSKLRGESDLASIATLGFRGEALAAISAVSRVTLRTREPKSVEGSEVVVDGGTLRPAVPCGCPTGTTIVVRDLFFNTPARRKFLKKDTTEAATVGAMVEKLALANHTVAFEFIKEGKTSLLTEGGGLRKAARALLGPAVDAMLTVEGEQSGIKIKGLISPPEAARPNRAAQFFFVCGRYIRSRTLQVAVEEAAHGRIPAGRYPACLLLLELAPEAVDPNVHPQKLEVRFANERAVYDLTTAAVRAALDNRAAPPDMLLSAELPFMSRKPAHPHSRKLDVTAADWSYPDVKPERRRALPQEGETREALASARDAGAERPSAPPVQEPAAAEAAPSQRPAQIEAAPAREPEPPATVIAAPVGENISPQEPAAWPQSPAVPADFKAGEPVPNKAAQRQEPARAEDAPPTIFEPVTLDEGAAQAQRRFDMSPSFRMVGELFRTYFVAEFEGEVWLVDKHAARERILYEELLSQGGSASQRLIEPALCTLGRADAHVAIEGAEALLGCGIEAEAFGDGALIVRSLPMGIDAADCENLILELCGLLRDGRSEARPALIEKMLHKIACVAAVKAGDWEDARAGEDLVRRLAESPELRSCPHGRPCVKRIPRAYLEKEFYRT